MWCTIADTCEGLAANAVVREDEVDLSASQLGHSSYMSPQSNGSMKAGSSKTPQPRHNRPTDFVHRTRDAGIYTMMFGC